MSSPSAKISTAAISKSTRRTRGVALGNRDKPSSVATQIVAAPSVSGELLPAVLRVAERGKTAAGNLQAA